MTKVISVQAANRCIACYSCMFACARVRGSFSPQLSAVQVRTQGGLQGKIGINVCQGCLEPNCVEGCQSGALTKRPGGGISLNEQACTGCGVCSTSCPVGALSMHGGVPITCLHCGLCAKFCPHQVLRLVPNSAGGEQRWT